MNRAAAVLIALLLSSPAAASARRVAIATGSIVVPEGFVHRPLRGTDSTPGTIARADGKLIIHYDIGLMAGTLMHPKRRAECAWFIAHEIAGRPAYSGIWLEEGQRRIATTIHGDAGEIRALPANFTAAIEGEEDIADFLVIATSYVPATATARNATPARDPATYEMVLVHVADVTPPAFLFVVGSSAFRTVAALERFLATLPRGTTLRWDPGCVRLGNEPLLSSETELARFASFCRAHGITFVLVPSG